MLLLMAPIAEFDEPAEFPLEFAAFPVLGNPDGAFIWGLELFGGGVVNGCPVFGSVAPGVPGISV